MEIINNIEWYFNEPKNAKNKNTGKKITKKQLKTIVFDDSIKENIKFCFPLNDDFTITETRELSRPANIKQILTLIQDFYNEPLTQEIINKSFGENEKQKKEWKDNMIECYNDCDISHLTKIDIFDYTCTPDFCGIHLMEDNSENKGEYFIGIGPE